MRFCDVFVIVTLLLNNETSIFWFLGVSPEFVPQFSNERQADRIKEIKIRGEKGITPFFLISLIEHKSEVEYNIHMQIFRYMVYIWEKYERRMEQEKEGCTRRRDFRYPPIIPIHAYAYDTLLEHEDEISLVMLINKLQTIEDVEQFRKLPADKVDRILMDTPDYLLDIIANVLRSFLLKENVPEDETEALVGKVKEKKMGELFANMDKMDIQAERRKTAEERENRIRDVVSVGKQFGATKEELADRIQKSHGIDLKKAMEKVELYWNQPEAAGNEI